MADIYVPYINPVRFRSNDAQSVMPRIDKMANNINYQRGIYAQSDYVTPWLNGETIPIQMRYTLPFGVTIPLGIVTPSGYTSVNAVDVTPSGWVGDNIYVYNYTPTELGAHYFVTAFGSSAEFNLTSDIFLVKDNDSDLIEIQYYDTQNKYEGVFNNGTDWIWQPKTYFSGYAVPAQPANEYTMYIDGANEPRKINAEPLDSLDLIIADVSFLGLKKINRIFSCDKILLNGQPVQNKDNVKWDGISKSDLGNVTVNLVDIDNDGFVKNY